MAELFFTDFDVGDFGDESEQVSSGDTIFSAIDFEFDYDWYQVTLTQDVTYTFELEGFTVGSFSPLPNSYLTLYDSFENFVVDDDGFDEPSATFTFTPTLTDTYFIEAGPADDSDIGGYRLSISSDNDTPPPPPPNDPFNPRLETDVDIIPSSIFSTFTLEAGDRFVAGIQNASDIDLFQQTVEAGELYVTYSLSVAPNPDLTPAFSVGGNFNIQDSQFVNGLQTQSVFYSKSTQNTQNQITFGTTSFDNDQGDYLVGMLQALRIEDGSDLISNTVAGAQNMSLNQAVIGQLNPAGDEDVFSLSIPENTGVLITMQEVFQSFSRDPDITVSTSDGQIVGQTNFFSPALILTSPFDEELIVTVNGNTVGTLGEYVLSTIELFDFIQDDITTTQSIGINGDASIGVLETTNDQDWFEISLEAGINYNVNLNGNNSVSTLEEISISIHNASGTKIVDLNYADFVSGTAEINGTISALETGTYYLAVKQPDSAAGSASAGRYNLNVTETTSAPDVILTAGEPQISINAPNTLVFSRDGNIRVDYENVPATADVPAIITTSISGGIFNASDIGPTNSFGTFVFSDSGSIFQSFRPSGSLFDFSQTSYSASIADPSSDIDWQARKDPIRPSGLSDEAWDQTFENFTSNVGNTVQDLSLALVEDAYRLGQDGTPERSVDTVLQFELEQAGDFGSIGERLKDGSLGKGWNSIADLSLDIGLDGSVAVKGLLDGDVFRDMDVNLSAQYVSSIPLSKGVDLNGLELINNTPGQPVFESGVFSDNGYLLRGNNTAGYRVTTPDNDRYDFNVDGSLSQITLDDGSVITPNIDVSGNITGFVKADGETFTLNYDAVSGNLVSISDNENHNASFNYSSDAATLLNAMTDSGNSNFTYDALNNLTQAQRDGNPAINFAYNSEGKLASYDIGGSQQEIYTYDDAGAIIQTNALGEEVTTQFDLGGSIRSITNDLGETITFESSGFSQTIELADGSTATLNFNIQGQPTFISDANGSNISLQYDSQTGDVSRFTDARGNSRDYIYDNDGKLTQATWGDGSDLQFEYDLQGNLTAQTNRRGEETQITRDVLGRVTNVSDSSAGEVDYSYDARGNLTSATNAEGTTSITYDAADRATLIEYPNGNSLEYTYDAAGKRTSMINQDGEGTFYTYDAAARLETIADDSGVLITYGYDAAGRLVSEVNRNGTESTFEYDSAGRQTSITHEDSDGNVSNFYNYTYDNTGKQTRAETSDGTWNYEYDATGQLTRAEFTSIDAAIDSVVLEYTYDAAGNRISTSENGVVKNYGTNGLNQYTNVGGKTFNYDADGNTVAQNETGNDYGYLYDIQNRLIQVTKPDSSTIQYEYDIFGNRSSIIEDGVRTDFLVDPFGFGNVVGEYDGAGNKIASYTHGLGLVSKNAADGSLAYFEADGRGSITGLTDDAGDLVNEYHYTPFGQEIFESETVMNSFEFNGSFGITEDAEDLHYVRARTYDSETGRFLQEDPLFLDGDPENLYRFNFNDPNSYVDIDGENPLLIGALRIIGGIVFEYFAEKTLNAAREYDVTDPENSNPGEVLAAAYKPAIATIAFGASAFGKTNLLLKGFQFGVGFSLGALDIIKTVEAATFVQPLQPRPARGVGDPHYVTYDGAGYSFQAAGEFMMTRTLDNNFEIQVRQEPYQDRQDVSINTSMAVRSGQDVVEIQADGDVLVNGLNIQIADGDVSVVGLNGLLVREGDSYIFVNENGNGVRVDIKDGEWLDVVPFLDPAFTGQVEGLLGNNDGDGTNDLVLPDGTVLTQPIALDLLYGEYADAWRISDDSSLFTYEAGQSTATFTDTTFPQVLTTLDDLDPADRANAEQIALAAGLQPGTFEFETTVLDIALTGNIAFLPDVEILETLPSTTDIVIQRPPVTQDDSANVNEDFSVTLDVLANDSDPENDTLTLVSATDENGGNISIVNNQIEFSPGANFNGETQITYRVSDGQGNTTAGFANVTVLAVNDAPDAINDSFSLNEDGLLSDNVLNNDTDIDGDILAVQAASFLTANGGTVELQENGDFIYTPALNFNGIDSFEYTIVDASGVTDSAIVTLSIASVNDGPVAQNDDFDIDRDGSLNGNLLADNGNGVDSDVDGDQLRVAEAVITTAQGGTVTILENGDFTYEPLSGFSGTDSFEYTLFDGSGGSDIGTAIIEVNDSDLNEITGTNKKDFLLGTNGDDAISGLNGKDIIWAKDGNDEISGGNGKDLIFGGRGGDDISGGNGSDKLFGQQGNDVIDGGKGNDYIVGDSLFWGAGDDVLSGGDGKDKIFGGHGDDTLNGDKGNDTLLGGSGDDVINGGDGHDKLYGNDGDDILAGGAGNDRLYGGSGENTFIIGEGRDKAYGGKDQDTFVFESFDARADTIYGFEVGQGGDVLDLGDILSSYDPLMDDILDFVKVTEKKGNAEIQINTGSEFTTVAVIEGGVSDFTVHDLIQQGNLILDGEL